MPGIAGETSWEKLKRKFSAEPWVPIGCVATAAVLIGGFVSFKKGNYKQSQQMMRLRVLTQGATIIAVGVGAWGIPFTKDFLKPKTLESVEEDTAQSQSDTTVTTVAPSEQKEKE